VLKASIVKDSEDDLSEHDAHCRQRFEDHDDVQLVRFFNVLVVVIAIIVVIVVIVVIVFVVFSSSLVVSIVSI
jgi:t-SNARE complex subunit (syntaxin)